MFNKPSGFVKTDLRQDIHWWGALRKETDDSSSCFMLNLRASESFDKEQVELVKARNFTSSWVTALNFKTATLVMAGSVSLWAKSVTTSIDMDFIEFVYMPSHYISLKKQTVVHVLFGNYFHLDSPYSVYLQFLSVFVGLSIKTIWWYLRKNTQSI